jgi:hypothetical protein
MRVADDPLLLQAFMLRHGKATSHVLPGCRLPVMMDCLADGWQAGKGTVHVHPYADVEPMQPISLHPEVFEPRDEDTSHALWLPEHLRCANPIFPYGWLVAGLAGTVAFVLVLLGMRA